MLSELAFKLMVESYTGHANKLAFDISVNLDITTNLVQVTKWNSAIWVSFMMLLRGFYTIIHSTVARKELLMLQI